MNAINPRFTQTTDGNGAVETIIDNSTTLQWTAQPLPGPLPHQQASDECAALALGGHSDWHLPTRAELLTLVDITRFDPAIDADVFPFVTGGWFWSSDISAWTPDSAWFIDFSYGGVNVSNRQFSGAVLAVRSSAP
jgi:hypothetical protein